MRTRASLRPLVNEPFSQFGSYVSLDGPIVAVGASENAGLASGPGRAYVFERDLDGTWSEADQFDALDTVDGDAFGGRIALEDGRLAVAAPGDDEGTGAVYVFDPVVVSPQLTLTGSCPGEITLAYEGTTPRDLIVIYRSDALGSTVLENGDCTSTELALEAALPTRTFVTGFDSSDVFARTANESLCGTHLQLLDRRTCLVSETVQLPASN